MAANVESMFYVRETPWHGLGTKVLEAPASKDALQLAGLNWRVMQEPIYTAMEELVDGYIFYKLAWRCYRPLQGDSERRSLCIYGRIIRGWCEIRDSRELAGWQESMAACPYAP